MPPDVSFGLFGTLAYVVLLLTCLTWIELGGVEVNTVDKRRGRHLSSEIRRIHV